MIESTLRESPQSSFISSYYAFVIIIRFLSYHKKQYTGSRGLLTSRLPGRAVVRCALELLDIDLSSMHLDPLRNETSVNKNSMLRVVYWFMNNFVGSTHEAPINKTVVYSREDSILIGWLFVLCGLSLLFIFVLGVFCTLPSLANPNHTIPLLVLCVIMVIPIFVIGVCHIKGVP